MTATPNYVIGVLDPAGARLLRRHRLARRSRTASTRRRQVARDQAIDYFDSVGLNHELLSPDGTDAFNFNQAGIPASGLLTGQDCCKTQHEVDLFGGSLGNFEGNVPSFDGGCVDNPFRWCDNLSNNDPNVLTFMSKAFATHGRPDGLRHEGDVGQQQHGLQQEAADQRGGRASLRDELGPRPAG